MAKPDERFDMTDRTCSADGCDSPIKARNLCNAHYLRARRWQELPAEWESRMHNTLSSFLFERIEVAGNGCWTWVGNTWANGYGRLAGKPRQQAGTAMSHRAVYEMHNGPIADGLVLDHLCRNVICCNPDHLEPVSNRENLVRGESPMARAVRTNTCLRGHEYAGDNLYVSPGGVRKCRACLKHLRSLRYQREAAKA